METGGTQLLDRALDDLNSTSLTCLSQSELARRVIALENARRKFDAAIAATVAEADRAGVAQNRCLRNMGQYVASRTHCDPAPVRSDVLLGRWLDPFPIFTEGFAEGKISRRHLVELRRVDNIRVHHAMIRDQQLLVSFVEDLEWKSWLDAVGYWLMANDPDGAEPKDPTERNTLTFSPKANGRLVGRFDLDPMSAAVFKQQLGATEQRLFHKQNETGGTRRSVGQRRVEALMTIFALASGNRTGKIAAPLVTLVMSQKVAEDTLRRVSEEDQEPIPVDYGDVDGRCELIDGTPIHPRHALALLAVAEIRRQVLVGESRTLDLGETTRLFPEYMKTALLVEARGQCSTPGCDAPFHWLQADHITPAAHGGATATDRGEPQCQPDNRTKGTGPPLADRKPKQQPTQPISYHHKAKQQKE